MTDILERETEHREAFPENYPPVEIRDGAWLDRQQFPPIRWVVEGLIAEGLTVLVGPPKLGKSWFALALALAVASGGRVLGCLAVGKPRPVLYLALEDGYRRLQSRARHLLGEGEPIPGRFECAIKGPPRELLESMTTWLDENRDDEPLVIVDTLAKIRPAERAGESAYTADYRFVGGLKNLVDDVAGAAMVLVHHTNKRGAGEGDFLEAVSGTNGIAGAADCTIVLARPRKDQAATISVTGRDVPEGEYAATCSEGVWTLDGDSLKAAAAAVDERRQTANLGERSAQIVAYVNAHPAGVRPTDVDKALGITDARTQLGKLAKAGRINHPSHGLYIPGASGVTGAIDEYAQVIGLRPVN